MAPVLLPPDASRHKMLDSAAKSNRYLAANLDQLMSRHPEKFAVVCNGELVAVGKNPEEAKAEARRAGHDLQECLLVSIPRKGATHYF